MNRYCVADPESNLTYMFNTRDEADDQAQRLNSGAIVRPIYRDDQETHFAEHIVLDFKQRSADIAISCPAVAGGFRLTQDHSIRGTSDFLKQEFTIVIGTFEIPQEIKPAALQDGVLS